MCFNTLINSLPCFTRPQKPKFIDPTTDTPDRERIEKKWKALQLNNDLLEKHFEDVAFLIETRLIYTILAYQNSTQDGWWKHEIRVGYDFYGQAGLQIQQNGSWVFVKSIKENFNWDHKEKYLVSKTNPHERWSYLQYGLVPIDRLYHHAAASNPNYPAHNAYLHPVMRLSASEMDRVLTQAHRFRGVEEGSSPREKKCVIQFFTDPRSFIDKEHLKNLQVPDPIHCTIRLILANGDVYSTGFDYPVEEENYINHPLKYMSSVNGQPGEFDGAEPRAYADRVVTSLPVDEECAAKILDRLNLYKKNGIRYHLLKQNCMTLGTHLLGMAGVDLNVNVPLGTWLYRSLPELSSIPLLGKPLHLLKEHMITPLCHKIQEGTPKKVDELFQKVLSVIVYIPAKIATLLTNLLIVALGGNSGSPQIHLSDKEPHQEGFLEEFPKLFDGLFNPRTSDIADPSTFIHWQLNQPSTDVYAYAGQPNMQILPPETFEAITYSEKRKAELQHLYRYCSPVN